MPLRKSGEAARRHTVGMTWMLVASERDVDYLRQRFSQKGPPWDQLQFKLRADTIIIYTPITPFNPRTGKPDPALRYLAKHLRIVPSQPGPFTLQYWRHTEQWQSLPCTGGIREIADSIEADEFGFCRPPE